MYAGGAQGWIGADLNTKVHEAVNNIILGTGKSPAQVQTNTRQISKLMYQILTSDPDRLDLRGHDNVGNFKQPTNNKK